MTIIALRIYSLFIYAIIPLDKQTYSQYTHIYHYVIYNVFGISFYEKALIVIFLCNEMPVRGLEHFWIFVGKEPCMSRFVRFLTPFAFLLALAATAFPAAGVSAASTAKRHHTVHLMPTHHLGKHPHAQPAVSGSGDLIQHGGPVQHDPQTYVVFWGSSWQASDGSLNSTGAVVDAYFRDVGGTSFTNILTQYYDGGGQVNNDHAYGGYWIDGNTPNSDDSSCGGSTIQDSSIQAEVNNAIAANGWPSDTANAIYYVYTPDGYYINDGSGSCSEQQFCAYHGYSSSSLAYAAMPYPMALNGCGVPSYPNGDPQGDSLVSVTSHEQAEAITDPQLNAWYDRAGYEIGDKCAWNFSQGYTYLNGGTFEIQTEYSNASHSCVNAY